MRDRWIRCAACVTLVTACVAILARPMEAWAYTYHKGFSYTKIPGKIKKKMKGNSYHKNKNIGYSDLRYLTVKYVNYHGDTVSGELIVNKKIAKNTLKAFYDLYKIQYPIQQMKLIDEYGGDDETSMARNNTSAFNYRVIANTSKLSNHALGMAIDINPRVNPYIVGKTIAPLNAKKYVVRDIKKCTGKYAKYMIHKNDTCYKIMKKYGFSWGGDWNHAKDYQHFEA